MKKTRFGELYIGDRICAKRSPLPYIVQSFERVAGRTIVVVTLKREQDDKILKRTMHQLTKNWRLVQRA